MTETLAPTAAADAALRLVAAAPSLGLGVAALDPSGVVIACNPAFERLLGPAATNVVGSSLAAAVEAMGPVTTERWRRALAAEQGGVVPLGAAAAVLHLGAPTDGWRAVALEPAAQLPRAVPRGGDEDPALRDDLTGLGNRRLLAEILEDWEAHPPSGGHGTLLMVDLDRFKQVNDTLGHAIGDRLLQRAAERIRASLRADDQVLRLGGDEFVILQADGPQPEASRAVASRVVEFLRRPFLVDGHQINVGASVGVATLADGVTPMAHLLRHADLALHAAKDAGRGTMRTFDPEMEARATRRRDLEVRLRRALGRRELSLVYQPQVDISRDSVQGFEALLRWHNDEVGPIGPDVFIPLAEELGEIHAIGEWVLREACTEAATWADELVVAVNVSAVQLEDPSFAGLVARILDASGLPAHRLEIEITEGVLLAKTDVALQQLWAIRALGVGIAMDDFGTGYSSLSHLNSFPFSAIKIDQSFVRGESTHRSRSLVDAIIALGSSLGIRTVVEGVETTEQLDRLAGKGPVEIQGYLVSRPMPPASVGEFVARHQSVTGSPR